MPGIKYNMTTFDEVVTESTIDFMGKAKAANKPFFVWMNPTRAHVLTHLSPKYEAMRNTCRSAQCATASCPGSIGSRP
jgi:hypothetical protein